MPSFSLTEGVVLRGFDVGEEDRILTLLTRDFGLLRAAVTGGRSLRRGRAGALDLFSRVRITLQAPRREGGLARIRSEEVLDPFLRLREDYTLLATASFLCETLSRCVQEQDPTPRLYRLLLVCLEALRRGDDPSRVLLLFETRLLTEGGWGPELTRCLACRVPISGPSLFLPEEGGILHPGCAGGRPGMPLSPGDRAGLLFLASRRIPATLRLALAPAEASRLLQLLHPFAVRQLGFEARAARALPQLSKIPSHLP